MDKKSTPLKGFSILVFIAILIGSIYYTSNTFAEMNTKLAEQQEQITKQNKKIESLLSQLEEQKETIQKLIDKNNKLQDRTKQQETQLQEKDKQLEEKDKKIRGLEEDLQAKKKRERLIAQQQERKKEQSEKQLVASASHNHSSSSAQSSQDTPSRSKPSESKTMYMEATAYTANCAGCSGITRTGINLNENRHAKVIAVDPSVIPLGTKVWVEGYGYAVAGDTGGAIKGNRIDIHLPTKSDALSFGRRTVKVKILN